MSDRADERLFAVIEAAAAWHVDEGTALAWITEGRVRAVTDAAGVLWVPVGEVARHQTVLGQNRDLPNVCGTTKYAGVEPCEQSVAAALADAREICTGWGLTSAETAALVAGDPIRAAAVIRIRDLLDMYSDPLPRMWMTIPSKKARLGGTPEHSVRPIDYALTSPEGGIWDVLALLEAYTQGK